MKKSIGTEFFEKTRYEFLSESDQTQGHRQPPLEGPVDHGLTVIDLPSPDAIKIPSFDLRQAIEQRRSVRKYLPAPLTMDELTYLLWCTQGVQKIVHSGTSKGDVTRRTVPSAGARHPFDTLVLVNRVDGLQTGLYRYLALDHKLVLIDSSDGLADRIAAACLGQEMVARAAATFIWVADVYRTTWRYVERGYRYMLLDAGHVCQNLYLCAESIDCGTCAVGAYNDVALNDVLGLDGEDRFVIYLAPVGKKPR